MVLTRDARPHARRSRSARALAEAARGDLFVSLHANAAPRRSVHGIETYYLDENHERHSLTRRGARERRRRASQVNALQRTLAKLRVSEVSPQSRRLAELVQRQIVRGMPRSYRPVPDLGAKKGPVLRAVPVEHAGGAGRVGLPHQPQRGDAAARRRATSSALAEQIAEALARYRDDGQRVALGGAR